MGLTIRIYSKNYNLFVASDSLHIFLFPTVCSFKFLVAVH